MSNNRLGQLFSNKKKGILNVYFTAGHPTLNSTVKIITTLDECGADLVEIGMPYSDPMADGPTIQRSSEQALASGMSLNLLFDQIEEARRHSQIPLIMMGYYNQLLQFGMEKFLNKASSVGVDGMIIPDLPLFLYKSKYKSLFEANNIQKTFLITPETSDERILDTAASTNGFIYMVSKSSITGASADISAEQKMYFERIEKLNLSNTRLIGFGIHDKETYDTACRYSNGAIIGSAFIRALGKQPDNLNEAIKNFISKIR